MQFKIHTPVGFACSECQLMSLACIITGILAPSTGKIWQISSYVTNWWSLLEICFPIWYSSYVQFLFLLTCRTVLFCIYKMKVQPWDGESPCSCILSTDWRILALNPHGHIGFLQRDLCFHTEQQSHFALACRRQTFLINLWMFFNHIGSRRFCPLHDQGIFAISHCATLTG